MRQFLLAFEVILWKWHYFKCYFLSRHVCCLCVYCSCHCLTPNADRRMASHTDCCQNRTFDNVFRSFWAWAQLHTFNTLPKNTSTSVKLCKSTTYYVTAALQRRMPTEEQKKLNFQCWMHNAEWLRIDSYAMAIFDIFQPNWNLFDYPNKVQIASSRSITTTGNEKTAFSKHILSFGWAYFPNGMKDILRTRLDGWQKIAMGRMKYFYCFAVSTFFVSSSLSRSNYTVKTQTCSTTNRLVNV